MATGNPRTTDEWVWAILDDETLDYKEKLVMFALLKSWKNTNNPSVSHMATMAGLSEDTVNRAKASLKDKKKVTWTKKLAPEGDWDYNVYTINPEAFKVQQGTLRYPLSAGTGTRTEHKKVPAVCGTKREEKGKALGSPSGSPERREAPDGRSTSGGGAEGSLLAFEMENERGTRTQQVPAEVSGIPFADHSGTPKRDLKLWRWGSEYAWKVRKPAGNGSWTQVTDPEEIRKHPR